MAASASGDDPETGEGHKDNLETTKAASASGDVFEKGDEHIDDPEKTEVTKENRGPKDDGDTIPVSTVKKILHKLEKASEERNAIKGFVPY